MSKPEKQLYEFGPYVLDPAERQLREGYVPVALEPKTFDVLLALVERHGELVGKEELMRRVWPDTFVEEMNLARHISALRKVLDQEVAGPSYIQTVPKHGYRFTASVRVSDCTLQEIVFDQTTTSVLYEEEIVLPEARSASPVLPSKPKVMFGRLTAGKIALGVLALTLCVGFIGLWLARKPNQESGRPPIRSIAVLPFKPLDAASSEPHLEIGVADTLITRLSNLGELTVRPTSAIRNYAERDVDALIAGRELRVDSVLEGSLQRRDDRLRVTVRLLRVSDGQSLWAYQCDTACTDIFQTQDTVSLRVAEALRSHLSAAEQQTLTKRGTNDVEAYQIYLKGLYFFNRRNAEGYGKAIEYYQQAIARDPGYALAYNGLAVAQRWLLEASGDRTGDLTGYKATLQKAAALDPTLPEVHATLGLLAQNDDWDWAAAEREYQEAIRLNPNFARAHHWYGEYLFLMGRHEAGLRELRRAQEIDPLSLIIHSDIAKCYYFAGKYEQAIAQARHTLELDPNFIEPHYWLTFAYYGQGRWDEALTAARKVQALDQRLYATAQIGTVLAAQGKRNEAFRLLAELQQAGRERQVATEFFAWIHQALGEKEQALHWLDQAYQAHEVSMLGLRSPLWESLRTHPRFQALYQRMHFPEPL
ncbi:MAG: tetratricopeptide repeat protein [Acidobacteria bacterium]|nr:tetratricopeptide repeat protein [Acidobacteriota bacterium]